jgi:hypothetical protein
MKRNITVPDFPIGFCRLHSKYPAMEEIDSSIYYKALFYGMNEKMREINQLITVFTWNVNDVIRSVNQ